jgi:hypothetical protein
MARIYRTTDKISYKIGELEIKISPLSVHDKATLHDLIIKSRDGGSKAMIDGSIFALKAAIKEVTGLVDTEDKEYKVSFDDNGYLTDSCISDLMNIEESSRMIALCSQLLAGIPSVLPEGVTLKEDIGPKK